MKVSSKPISSPSRTEKFPPPLMRFLSSNGGSRSRGRSRSSPMFVRKKNTVIETQEPSSPKVTCIGQVRVRRSSRSSGSRSNRAGRSKPPAKQRPCWWVRGTPFCNNIKLKPRSFRPVWRKWVSFFRFGYCKKVDTRDDSSRLESNRRGQYDTTDDIEDEDEDVDDEEGAEVKEATEVFFTSSPPKNALLLTRCRSAPYRSSSLASQFWGSPLGTSETGDGDDEANKGLQRQQEERTLERPISESEPNCRDSMAEARNDEKSEANLGISKDFEGSINGRARENSVQELKAMEGGSAGPLTLTRCKSEPARIGERLNPEASFWRPTRMGFAEPRSSHICD